MKNGFYFCQQPKISKTRRKLRKTLGKNKKTKDTDEKSFREFLKSLPDFNEQQSFLRVESSAKN